MVVEVAAGKAAACPIANESRAYVPPAARSAISFKQNIHYLRGIAAVLVLLGHSGFYLESYLHIGWAKALFPSILGLYGVAIFFAISGYLMASLIGKEKSIEFLARRVARIYPLFIICTIFVMFVLFPQVIPRWAPLSLSLSPMDDATYLMRVEWTIVHEVFFYVALFLVAIVGLRRWMPHLAVAWLAAIFLAAFDRMEMPHIGRATIVEIGLMTANAGFAAGLLIPTISKHFRRPLLSAAIFAAAAVAHHMVPAAYVRIVAGVGSSFLVMAAVQQELKVGEFLDWLLTKLGDWSYALYLIHVPIITYFYTFYMKVTPPWYVWPAAVSCAMLAGALFGELDQYLTERGKVLVNRSPRPALIASMTLFLVIYFTVAVMDIV
jgi:peptidoglycan/LPS O-acetylase OafA/YrhL